MLTVTICWRVQGLAFFRGGSCLLQAHLGNAGPGPGIGVHAICTCNRNVHSKGARDYQYTPFFTCRCVASVSLSRKQMEGGGLIECCYFTQQGNSLGRAPSRDRLSAAKSTGLCYDAANCWRRDSVMYHICPSHLIRINSVMKSLNLPKCLILLQ